MKYEKISLNVPADLLEKIDAAAAADDRTRTSWLISSMKTILRMEATDTFVNDSTAGKSSPSIVASGVPVVYPRARTRRKK